MCANFVLIKKDGTAELAAQLGRMVKAWMNFSKEFSILYPGKTSIVGICCFVSERLIRRCHEQWYYAINSYFMLYLDFLESA